MKNAFYPVAEFPDFPAMTPEAAHEAMPRLLADAKAAVDALEEKIMATISAMERRKRLLSRRVNNRCSGKISMITRRSMPAAVPSGLRVQ